MSDPHFTPDEILLAADRFLIEHHSTGSRLQLAQDFMGEETLSTVEDCCQYVRSALARGHVVNIKVPHGSSRVSPATG